MNSINLSDRGLSICHKNNCVNIKGNLAKAIAFGLATIIVIGGIAAILKQPN
ncbi:hypothetical protein SAMN04487992_102218 [Cellulophaga baltica]|uniref:Uncharacterized protein n=1 Tax=Cellulophaga baltica TaxID=76594 RepID=A0A1G7EBA8_9FLAO|nr:hypothetical protein SAMN04487992_102218 [Cellulophaga baltica]